MNFSNLIKRSESFVTNNSSTILTSVGVVGTVATAVLTGKATLKCHDILVDEDASTTDKVKEVWKDYIPPVTVGTLTVASIIMANRLETRKAAALAAAYGISEKAFTEYKDKVVEKLGENKERAVRDEIAQDQVNRAESKEVIIIGSGNVLCFDTYTGRYFESSVETIKRAQNTVNQYILDHMYASLSHFYDEIDIAPVDFSDHIGWKSDNLIDISFSTVMAPDQRPCIAMSFATPPIPDYTVLY